MFTNGWQLTLMKRMKKRLTETADHYRSQACQTRTTTVTTAAATATTTATAASATTTTDTSAVSVEHCELHDRLDRLYRTLSYWLDEPRLHDPSLYVPALPAEYQPQLLVTVFQSQSVCITLLLLCFILLLL